MDARVSEVAAGRWQAEVSAGEAQHREAVNRRASVYWSAHRVSPAR